MFIVYERQITMKDHSRVPETVNTEVSISKKKKRGSEIVVPLSPCKKLDN